MGKLLEFKKKEIKKVEVNPEAQPNGVQEAEAIARSIRELFTELQAERIREELNNEGKD